jgi:hypothetical protein
MNQLYVLEKCHVSNLDGDADACVLGKGWKFIQSTTPQEKM